MQQDRLIVESLVVPDHGQGWCTILKGSFGKKEEWYEMASGEGLTGVACGGGVCGPGGFRGSYPAFLPSLTIVLSSSGMGGGTGSSPEIFITASKRWGQTSKQVPHRMHSS